MIYFSGPASTLDSRTFNLELTAELEKAGFAVFLPQRDGINAKKPPYSTMNRQELRSSIFEKSLDLIMACDVFLFLLDRHVPEESQIFHLGLAYAHRLTTGCDRYIIGLQTDGSLFLGAKLNPTLQMAFDDLVGNQKALVKALQERKKGS